MDKPLHRIDTKTHVRAISYDDSNAIMTITNSGDINIWNYNKGNIQTYTYSR